MSFQLKAKINFPIVRKGTTYIIYR